MNLTRFFKAVFIPVRRVTPASCMDRIRSGATLLIDVREPREWEKGVVEPAARLPLTDLLGARRQWKPFLEQVAGRDLVLYCAVGGRAVIAAKLLAAEGYRVASGGGYAAWAMAGRRSVRP